MANEKVSKGKYGAKISGMGGEEVGWMNYALYFQRGGRWCKTNSLVGGGGVYQI